MQLTLILLALSGLAVALPRAPVYFGLALPHQDVLTDLEDSFSNNSPSFYTTLQSTNRIQPAFHVTLIHVDDSDSHPDIWNYYKDLLSRSSDPVTVQVQLNHVVWDERLMAIDVTVDNSTAFPTTNDATHITVGTVNKSVKPVESNDLLVDWEGKGSILGEAQGVSAMSVGGVVTGMLQSF